MMADKASRALLRAARRPWHSSASSSLPKFYNYNRYSTTALSSITSSPILGDRSRERERRYELPRTLGLPPLRYSSSTQASQKEDSLREKMQARQVRGRVAASKGAHSVKDLVQRYGPVFVGTYLAVYVSTVASLFAGIESGALDPAYLLSLVSDAEETKSTAEVVTEFFEYYAWTAPYAPTVGRNPELANLAVAWIATKFTEPLRLGFTVMVVPRIARTLGLATPAETSEGGKEEVTKEQAQKCPSEESSTQK